MTALYVQNKINGKIILPFSHSMTNVLRLNRSFGRTMLISNTYHQYFPQLSHFSQAVLASIEESIDYKYLKLTEVTGELC